LIDYGLTGRAALVTGGSRGIGRAVAAALLRVGCRVAILSRDAASLGAAQRALQDMGAELVAVRGDVAVRDDVRAAVESVIDRFGAIDVLVNNAAIINRDTLLQLTEDAWDQVMATNVKSLLFACQAVAPSMMRRHWGRIINAASYGAWHPSHAHGLYAASKAAVIALTKAWAAELAPYGIHVNAYAPGPIATDMVAGSPGTPEDVTRPVALGRMGRPEEVADAVAFLASERASFLTGAVLEISGGKYAVQDPWTAWAAASKPSGS